MSQDSDSLATLGTTVSAISSLLLQQTLGSIQSLAPVVDIPYRPRLQETHIDTTLFLLWFDIYHSNTDATHYTVVEHVSISLTLNRAHAVSTFLYAGKPT